MQEILVALCLAAPPGICADRLVPVAAPDCAAAEAKAEAWIAALPADLTVDPAAGAPRCIPRPAPDIAFDQVAPGVFVHRGEVDDATPQNRGDVANIGFILGDDAVAVIDAGGSRGVGEQVYLAIRAVTDLPIRHLLLTHMHPDHIFGAAPLIEAGATALGHPKLAEALAARQGTYHDSLTRLIGAEGFLGSTPPAPAAAPATLELGGRALQTGFLPTAHSVADMTVFDPATGTLFAGDVVFDEHAPSLDGSLLGWIAALEGLDRPGLERVIPGHGGPVLSWPEGGAPLLRYLRLLRDETRAALKQGMTIREAAAAAGWSEQGAWKLFELFHPRNATAAYAELEWE